MKAKNEIEVRDTLPVSFDGPNAAPEHHRVIFENDRVRVVDFRVSAGDTVPLHTHRYATVNYVISISDFCSYDSDGNVKLDTRETEVVQQAGAVFYLPPFPPLHSVKNIGSGEIRGVTVELKD
jgi:quercetin dioxygenase-like cupin family protein